MVNPINSTSITDYNTSKAKAQEAQAGTFEQSIEKAMEEKDEKKLKKACSDLESIFLNMMFKQMRSTIQKSDLLEDDSSEEMYEDMLYENYANEISKGKGVGLADMLYKQLAKSMGKESEGNDAK
ncbi:MAG: rod-binding protein [Caulobacteraceae bacterium]